MEGKLFKIKSRDTDVIRSPCVPRKSSIWCTDLKLKQRTPGSDHNPYQRLPKCSLHVYFAISMRAYLATVKFRDFANFFYFESL